MQNIIADINFGKNGKAEFTREELEKLLFHVLYVAVAISFVQTVRRYRTVHLRHHLSTYERVGVHAVEIID